MTHPLQILVAAPRMFAYVTAADSVHEYLGKSRDSVLQSLKWFCSTVLRKFGKEYFCEPNEEDVKRITAISAAKGFQGCIGSIDFRHWEWKNCSIAWAGQLKKKEKNKTIFLEARCYGYL